MPEVPVRMRAPSVVSSLFSLTIITIPLRLGISLLRAGSRGGGGGAGKGHMVDGRDSAWEEQGTGASRTQKHSEAGYGRPADRGAWTAKTVKRPRQQPAQAHPQYANYWAPLTRKRHTPRHIQHSPNTPTTGLCERGNDTSRSTGRSGRQKAATRRNMRREERVTVQGPVKEQQPDGMSHRGGWGGGTVRGVVPQDNPLSRHAGASPGGVAEGWA